MFGHRRGLTVALQGCHRVRQGQMVFHSLQACCLTLRPFCHQLDVNFVPRILPRVGNQFVILDGGNPMALQRVRG